MTEKIIEILQDKFFVKKDSSVFFDYRNSTQYKFRTYSAKNDVPEKFLKDLEADLKKPKSKKNLNISMREMKGFKKSILQKFVKENNSISDFENTFHSFFKHFGMDYLFHYFYIATDINNNPHLSPISSKYRTFLFNQDFTELPTFTFENFLLAIDFNFNKKSPYYEELQTNFYNFLTIHYEKAKEKFTAFYGEKQYHKLEVEQSFDLKIHNAIKKHIPIEKQEIFTKFYKGIIVEKPDNSSSLITIPKAKYHIMDIEFSYIIDKFPNINNTKYAKDACGFIANFTNENLSNNISIQIIEENANSSRIICELKNSNVNTEDLNDLFIKILELHESCELTKYNYVKPQFEDIYAKGIQKLQKYVDYIALNNVLPQDINSVKSLNNVSKI